MKKLPQHERRELEILRQLLVGPELIKLEQLSKRLENRDKFSTDVCEVLPQAMIKSTQQSDHLSRAMAPTIEEIVRLSVKRDIGKFADALFPVIGPAIRKSIIENLRQMLQSMNQMLENSLSWQGIKWRIQSIRSGVPYAQIVMLHSLIYEVEQVFLIHHTTGLLLSHVETENMSASNADMVSSMLTAIGDFVNDSFESDKPDSLDSIQVGNVSIWIEQSPNLVLALAIRGSAPESLRITMQETLEQVESLYSDALSRFKGDVTVFDSIRSILFECLQARYKSTSKGLSGRFWIATLVLCGLLAYWLFSGFQQSMLHQNFLSQLESEPGYLITGHDQIDGKLFIKGLRDPLSRPVDQLLEQSQLTVEELSLQFQPYQSLQESILLKRISRVLLSSPNLSIDIRDDGLVLEGFASEQRIRSIRESLVLISGVKDINSEGVIHNIDLSSLNKPDSVDLQVDVDTGHVTLNGVASADWKTQTASLLGDFPGIQSFDDSDLLEEIDLTVFAAPESVELTLKDKLLIVAGTASTEWIEIFKEQLNQHPRIEQSDLSQLKVLESEQLQKDIGALQAQKVFFDEATSFNFEASQNLDGAAVLIKNIISNAKKLSQVAKIEVRGFSDSVGEFADNVFLSMERADYVSQFLYNTGISPRYVVVKGLEAPVAPETSPEQRRYNRRVEFSVIIQQSE